MVKPHSHEAADKVDAAMESSREGMRALWISLGVLGVTALAQAVVVVWSGSVALLGDTLHNVADALTAVPLGIAFTLGRRAPNRRYTYGYGRAEDLAGVVIVLFIAASSVAGRLRSDPPAGQPAAGQSSVGGRRRRRRRIHRQRARRPLPHPHRPAHRLGGAGRRRPARPHRRLHLARRRARRRPASPQAGSWPTRIVGLLITVAIVVVLREAAREVYRRLMDAVDPALLTRAEQALADVPGVIKVGRLRLRWIGHQLHADGDLVLRPDLTLAQAHQVTVAAEQHLTTTIPRLTSAVIHPDPAAQAGREHHALEANRDSDTEKSA